MTTFMVYQCTYFRGKTYSMCFEGSQKSQRGLLLFSRVQRESISMFLQIKMYVIFDAKTKKKEKRNTLVRFNNNIYNATVLIT